MKTSLLLCLLCALFLSFGHAVQAADDPGDRFLEAYFLIVDGDAAERQSDWMKADEKYRGALEILNEIRGATPGWNPHIIDFRTRYCAEHLDNLRPKLAPAAPAAETPSPETAAAPAGETPAAAEPATAPAPEMRVGDVEKLMQLTADLQKAQNRIQELETEREQLQTRLSDALRGVTPTETTARVEELLKQNQDLAAQLAAAQSDLTKLRETSAVAITAAPEYVQLKSQLVETQGELARTKSELATVRAQLETVQTENRTLRASYEQIASQLSDANRRLAAAQAASSKDDEIIKQLRKENALLQQIVERREITAARPPTPRTETIHELRGWKPRKPQPKPAAPRSVAEAKPKENPAPKPAPPAKEESTQSKLVATVTAPPLPAPAQPVTPPPAPTPAPVVEEPPPVAPAAPAEPKATPTTRETAPSKAPVVAPGVAGLLSEARAAVSAKEFDKAIAKYNEVLGLEADNILALSNLGIIHFQQGRLDEAETMLRKAVVLAPNDSKARSLLGVVFFKKGMVENAFGELTRAVALDPRNCEAHNYLGITLSEKGWGTSAEQEIRKAVDLCPDYGDAHFNLAVLYLRQKTPRIEMARYHYMKALDLGAESDPQIDAQLKRTPPKASTLRGPTPSVATEAAPATETPPAQ